jgi:hypothetical protein
MIICEIIVNLLVIVQNKKNQTGFLEVTIPSIGIYVWAEFIFFYE